MEGLSVRLTITRSCRCTRAKGEVTYQLKPLTNTIQEVRHPSEPAKEAGVQTQMGNQGTACATFAEVPLFQQRSGWHCQGSHVWTNRPVWPQGGGRLKTLHRFPNTFTGQNSRTSQTSSIPRSHTPFKWRDGGTSARVLWATWLIAL